MKKSGLIVLLAIAAWPFAASAQQEPNSDLTVSGSATLISDYRMRGVSFSDKEAALQGAITVAHQSGFYVSAWSSSQAGYGTFGGSNIEIDAIAGYARTVGETTLDGGVVWYFFPGTAGHQYGEIYGSVSRPVGPVKAKLGANYAPKRNAIGDADNLWVYGDLSLPIASTPITLRSHLGYTEGEGSIYGGPRGHYVDYSLGADLSWKNLTLNLSYVGTDIGDDEADGYFTVPGGKPGRELVDGAVVANLTAAF